MSIIISKNGKGAKRVDASVFDRENYLQEYIYDNPESIPLYDIKEDIRLLILAREFQTNSGPIDAIGVDKDGEIYLVETKLYKNPDKRTVVAQVLDYGASLWRWSGDFNEFVSALNLEVSGKFGMTVQEKLKQFFEISDEEVLSLLDAISRNLNQGRFKFVVLMDHLEPRLKDLIVFINENSKFDLYAVELEYYKHEEYEIMIPKLFGAEVKKDIKTSVSGSARKKWDETSFFETAKEQTDSQYLPVIKKLYDFSKAKADEVKWGTGSAKGSFNPVFAKINTRSIYTVGTNGNLSLNFGWLNSDKTATDFRDKLKNEVEAKLKLTVPDNYREHFIVYPISEWHDKADQFMSIIELLTK